MRAQPSRRKESHEYFHVGQGPDASTLGFPALPPPPPSPFSPSLLLSLNKFVRERARLAVADVGNSRRGQGGRAPCSGPMIGGRDMS